jgi:hypothetical protein
MEKWTRISLKHEEFFDLANSYDEIIANLDQEWISCITTVGYRLMVRVSEIQAIYESGVDVLKNIWEKNNELEKLQKSIEEPSWE